MEKVKILVRAQRRDPTPWEGYMSIDITLLEHIRVYEIHYIQ